MARGAVLYAALRKAMPLEGRKVIEGRQRRDRKEKEGKMRLFEMLVLAAIAGAVVSRLLDAGLIEILIVGALLLAVAFVRGHTCGAARRASAGGKRHDEEPS